MIQKFQKAEQLFIPNNEETISTIDLEKFIIEHFQIPDNDLERISKFISQDNELEKIIFELQNLIKSKISYDKLQIKFYDEIQEDYLQLEVNIFTTMNIETSLKLEDELEQQLYELYDCNSADKILIIME